MADPKATMEHVGFLPSGPCCPICDTPFSLDNFRARSRQEDLKLPGGLTVHRAVELAMWCCPNLVELSIFTSAELLNPRWSLLQNALLLWHWAQPQKAILRHPCATCLCRPTLPPGGQAPQRAARS